MASPNCSGQRKALQELSLNVQTCNSNNSVQTVKAGLTPTSSVSETKADGPAACESASSCVADNYMLPDSITKLARQEFTFPENSSGAALAGARRRLTFNDEQHGASKPCTAESSSTRPQETTQTCQSMALQVGQHDSFVASHPASRGPTPVFPPAIGHCQYGPLSGQSQNCQAVNLSHHAAVVDLHQAIPVLAQSTNGVGEPPGRNALGFPVNGQSMMYADAAFGQKDGDNPHESVLQSGWSYTGFIGESLDAVSAAPVFHIMPQL
eukprot:scaffold104783_cov48-Prasinocladus_malaysianus.AAC.1